MNFLFWITAALSAPAFPVSEWLAPADHSTLDATEVRWSGYTFRIVYMGRGETAENWSRRITTWSSPSDILGAGSLATEAANIKEAIIADCPGSRSGTLQLFTSSGRPAAEFWIACDLYPETDRPDHYLVRMISGEARLLSAAITFRAPPTTAQIADASAYLDTLLICTGLTVGPACRSLPAPPRTAGANVR